jgi:hypothetical protein
MRLLNGRPLVTLGNRDDHVPTLVSFVDIPVGLGELLQRIASVDHRPDLALCRQLAKQHQVFGEELRSAIIHRETLAA